MNESHSKIIIVLLGAILCVLLLGRETVASVIGWITAFAALITIVYYIFFGVFYLLRAFRDEIMSSRNKFEPWLYMFIMWPAVIGDIIVLAAAYPKWIGQRITFSDAFMTIENWQYPAFLMVFSIVVYLAEAAYVRYIARTRRE